MMISLRRLWQMIVLRRGLGTALISAAVTAIVVTSIFLITNPHLIRTGRSNSNETKELEMQEIQDKMQRYFSDQRWEQLSSANLGSFPANEVMKVLLSSDEHTLPGMITAINSIRKNTKHRVKFYLFTNDHTLPHLKKWIDLSDLKKIDYVIETFNMEEIQDKITVRGARRELADPLNYARYYVLDYFPEISGNLVYIDSDCIVQGDLYELYSTVFDEDKIIAFSDDCSPAMKKFNKGTDTYRSYLNYDNPIVKKLKIDPKACSFNAGVYVADMNKWREQKIAEKLDYWVGANHKSVIYGGSKHSYGSQPPMMITFYNKFLRLPAKWNIRFLGTKDAEDLHSDAMIEDAKLLHWTGPSKPWRKDGALYRSVWKSYYVPDPTLLFMLP